MGQFPTPNANAVCLSVCQRGGCGTVWEALEFPSQQLLAHVAEGQLDGLVEIVEVEGAAEGVPETCAFIRQ